LKGEVYDTWPESASPTETDKLLLWNKNLSQQSNLIKNSAADLPVPAPILENSQKKDIRKVISFCSEVHNRDSGLKILVLLSSPT